MGYVLFGFIRVEWYKIVAAWAITLRPGIVRLGALHSRWFLVLRTLRVSTWDDPHRISMVGLCLFRKSLSFWVSLLAAVLSGFNGTVGN